MKQILEVLFHIQTSGTAVSNLEGDEPVFLCLIEQTKDFDTVNAQKLRDFLLRQVLDIVIPGDFNH